MQNTAKCLSGVALALFVTVGVTGQQTAPPPAPAPQTQKPAEPAAQRPAVDQPTFRVAVDLVTTDVIVRDGKGQFVADLKTKDFDVFEDGVKQDIASLVL